MPSSWLSMSHSITKEGVATKQVVIIPLQALLVTLLPVQPTTISSAVVFFQELVDGPLSSCADAHSFHS